ncbi:mucin-5AC-like, partial [Plectropomus leopardus]|uniref:mucin-5AC-like n=1 Tax=Plectropomus leopardus TaxID=160734 RepID=UPI001C4DCBCB
TLLHLQLYVLYFLSFRLLSPPNTSTPLRDLPTNTSVSKFTPLQDSPKSNTTTTTHTPSRPIWLTEKPSAPPSFSTTFSTPSPSRPASSLSSAAKDTKTTAVSKPTAPQTTCESTFTTTTTSITTRPIAAPRTSTTAAKTLQSKLKFFQSDNTANNDDKKTTTTKIDINKGTNVTSKVQEATAGQAVTVVVNVGDFGKKDTNVSLNTGGEKAKAAGGDSKTKASAVAFLSKKLAEENNNNNSKPSWANVVLKKTDKPSDVETPKRETEGVRGRVKLKADPSLLADLQIPADRRTPSPTGRTGLRSRTPERGVPKPRSASPSTSASENESPADWRSKLKPVSKPPVPSQPSQKPWANGAGKTQTSEPSVGPSPSSHLSTPSISVTPPASKGLVNGQEDSTANTKPESKITKTKPDYIHKDAILKELKEIDDSLNEWEKRGVELEVRLRSCEE